MVYPVVVDLDYENDVADIVDSVDDLVAALDDGMVDYYCIVVAVDFDVVVDFDVFHLQAQKKRLQGEGEPYHLIIKMVWHIYTSPSF